MMLARRNAEQLWSQTLEFVESEERLGKAKNVNDRSGFIEIARRVKTALGAEEVWVFGSQARGTARPGSDTDVLAVVSESAQSRYQRAVSARKVLGAVFPPVDIVVMTRAEWDRERKAACSLASTAAREGVRV